VLIWEENNHDPKNIFRIKKRYFECKLNTSARVASTTVVATSLGPNSSSHVEIVCCTGGVGSGTIIHKKR
jgi:hypothetical protein